LLKNIILKNLLFSFSYYLCVLLYSSFINYHVFV
jgi:hypothetical protein